MKVTVILSLPLLVRNYLTTKILQDVPGYTFDFIVEKKLLSDPAVRANPIIGSYEVSKEVFSRQHRLFDVITWRYRHLSKSFRFRIKRIYFFNLGKKNNLFFLKRIYLFLSFLKTTILGSKLLFDFYLSWCDRTIGESTGLEDAIRDSGSKIVLFPCTSFDPSANEIIDICRKYDKISIFLIDNWDNLSSKSLFLKLPDYFGVWGEQSKQHAISIHKASPHRTFSIGTPRFEVYRNPAGESPYPFPYFTFCGCSIAFDEVSALHHLDEEIENNKSYFKNTKIVYRPHPWRQPRVREEKFNAANFKNVVLDRPMTYRVETEDVRSDIQPDLSYYPNLIKNSLGSICPLSTMMIENVLCDRPVLALAYDDGVHRTSPSYALENYLHFEGVENLKGLSLVRNLNQLGPNFLKFARQPKASQADGHDFSYIVTFNDQTYPQHLSRLLDVSRSPLSIGS